MINLIARRTLEVCAVTVCILVIASRPSHAYIDPGTGSFVLQAALAGLLGVAFVIKTSWRNLTHAVARILGRRHTDAG